MRVANEERGKRSGPGIFQEILKDYSEKYALFQSRDNQYPRVPAERTLRLRLIERGKSNSVH